MEGGDGATVGTTTKEAAAADAGGDDAVANNTKRPQDGSKNNKATARRGTTRCRKWDEEQCLSEIDLVTSVLESLVVRASSSRLNSICATTSAPQ